MLLLLMSDERVVIRLPDPRVLRVAARSVLLAAALLALLCLRAADLPARCHATSACHSASQTQLLLRDLRREGLLGSGGLAVFLDAPDRECGSPALPRENVPLVASQGMPTVGALSVDFLLDCGYLDGDRFGFVDRVLKVGGTVAAPIGRVSAFRVPQNYRVVYVRRFVDTFVAIKKIAHTSNNGNASNNWLKVRRALAAPEATNVALSGEHTEGGQSKNSGRKLLLPEIRLPVAAHDQRWFDMHRPRWAFKPQDDQS